MNRKECGQLLARVVAFCPAQSVDEFTAEAWLIALGDTSYTDATEAVNHLGALELEPGRTRYIEPGHIRHEVRRIRRQRLDTAPVIEPPSGLDGQEYLDWSRRTRAAIADGHTPTPPVGALVRKPLHLAITKGIDQ
ncbi:hypothetical protein ACQCX2_07735 [Propionibacteriaceae bacterium Y1700]|uniref:hypothetical protein n=1 Tax=Microlunatus sp. Y1700 TaxID=3418487 RepID=UPI003DA78D4B